MKKVVITLFAAFLAFNLSAQDNMFTKGEKVLNLGIGFGGGYYSSYSSGYSKIPFLSAAVDVGIIDGVLDVGSVGVGGYIGYSSAKWESGYNYGWKESNFIIGPRGTFHYPLVDKLDTYAGILLGYQSVSWKETGDWGIYTGYAGGSSGIYFSGFVRARYYFTESLAVMLELGSGGLALANVGVSFKF